MTTMISKAETTSLIETGIKLLGSEHKLAMAGDLTQSAIWKAKRNGTCSPKMATGIHRATEGRIPRWALRPDLFNEGDNPPPSEGANPPVAPVRITVARVAVPDAEPHEPRISIDTARDGQYLLSVSAIVSWEDALAVSEIVRKYQHRPMPGEPESETNP